MIIYVGNSTKPSPPSCVREKRHSPTVMTEPPYPQPSDNKGRRFGKNLTLMRIGLVRHVCRDRPRVEEYRREAPILRPLHDEGRADSDQGRTEGSLSCEWKTLDGRMTEDLRAPAKDRRRFGRRL